MSSNNNSTVLSEVLTPNHWKNICDRVEPIALKHIFPYIKSKRVRSSSLSEVFEIQSAEYFNSIGISTKPCGNDKEPDLFFNETEEFCEIKVTSSNKREWMGGKHSKKSSEFILIKWNYQEEKTTIFGIEPESLKFSVINTFLDKDDWNILGDNFSGTKITSKMLKNKKVEILV